MSNVPEPAVAPPAAPTTVRESPNDHASASSRDPFAPPAANVAVVTPPPSRDDVPRKARRYSLEQLKLVGIAIGDESRAMLVDPRGKGWIVTRGDHVGEPYGERAGWRVQKIKNEEIVFVREDATKNDGTAETRVLALHAEAQRLEDADD
jgi:type IV pilus assembly protein PilP